MAAPWPITLQDVPNTSGFGLKFGNNKIRTEMDAGPPKVRNRYTKRFDDMNVSFWATNAQLDIFNTFHDLTLGGGTLPFEFTDPTSGNVREFRIKGEPNITPVGFQTWNIEMTWERLPF